MRRGNTRRRSLALLAALGVGLGCGEAREGAPATVAPDMRSTASELYVASSALWRPLNVPVPVCWENPGANDATQRQWVRDAVARTWEARSAIRFTGWDTCQTGSKGIRIKLRDVRPGVWALGKGLDGMQGGMDLNFTFQNWETSCQSRLQYCIEVIAVHEFGHAMGYAHEQNRPDTPSWCDREQGSSGDWTIGPWDLSSVMNYCNPSWNGNGNLSATDVEGARLTYGVAWESLGGTLADSPSVATWGPGHLDVYIRNASNGALHHRAFNNGWSAWEVLDSQLGSDPAAISWGPGRVDVFARGSDGALLQKVWQSGQGWSGWYSLGGQMVGKPSAVSFGPGHLDVYVRGTDNALHHRAFNNGWSNWENLGGQLTSDPGAVSWDSGRVDVFARGTDGALWQKAWQWDQGWSSWNWLGGQLVGAPSAASRHAGHLDVYVRWTDNALYHRWFSNGWSNWEWLGGELTSSPSAVSWDSGRIDIFYRGPDNTLRHSWWNNGW